MAIGIVFTGPGESASFMPLLCHVSQILTQYYTVRRVQARMHCVYIHLYVCTSVQHVRFIVIVENNLFVVKFALSRLL